jgi:branched-chain amino acid transport system ATP-binding protein
MNSMTAILKVQNLFKSFGGVHAVKDVSFSLQYGQLLAMIGPNGAGKSTCFNLINGQLSPDQGSIFIMGQKVNDKKPRDVWKIGVGRTFQITSTFPSMTVLENVQMSFLSYNRQTKSLLRQVSRLYVEESMELLNLVGIADQAERACGVLAYGDLKRVEMAVALANQPKLLLMDEPTAGMGPAERQGLMKLTKRIVSTRKIGVLFTEHDMKVVFDYAEWIIVLNRGEMIAEGTPEEVQKNSDVKEIYLGTPSA